MDRIAEKFIVIISLAVILVSLIAVFTGEIRVIYNFAIIVSIVTFCVVSTWFLVWYANEVE